MGKSPIPWCYHLSCPRLSSSWSLATVLCSLEEKSLLYEKKLAIYEEIIKKCEASKVGWGVFLNSIHQIFTKSFSDWVLLKLEEKNTVHCHWERMLKFKPNPVFRKRTKFLDQTILLKLISFSNWDFFRKYRLTCSCMCGLIISFVFLLLWDNYFYKNHLFVHTYISHVFIISYLSWKVFFNRVKIDSSELK